ncbi:MAG: cobalamin-dependent protein [Sedimentisphaerales bacterium]|nr:cobalamin-dependent protein [Sedimentisphaerales bacterium]
MNIVYLNGPYHKLVYSRSSRSPAVTKSGTVYYPMWLAYAAGLAQQRTDFNIRLLDAVALKLSVSDLVQLLEDIKPDIVFCDTSTPSINEDIETAQAIKTAFANCKVVMVGTHATALPEEVLAAASGVDAVALGEYDETAIDLAEALAAGRDWTEVSGIALRQDGAVLRTGQRQLIEDLDSFPFVSEVYKRHLSVRDYFFAAAKYPMVMTITSRGCPHRCSWCLYPQVMHRGKYRMRSSDSVAAEFAYIASEMPDVREVGIEDDLFTGSRKRLQETCEKLIAQGNRLPFWCDTRVDLDYETMRLMKAAGCRLLIAGFESGSQAVLDRINKGTQAEQAFDFVQNAKRANLLVHGCFVLGNPGETPETMAQTVKFATQLDPDTAQFFPMIVYPGTSMYSWAESQGALRTKDWREWLTPGGMHNSVVDLPHLPGEQVRDYCDRARREFYLRKGYVWKKIKQSLSDAQEAKRNVKAFCRFAKHLVG